jgi:hypothetical protein
MGMPCEALYMLSEKLYRQGETLVYLLRENADRVRLSKTGTVIDFIEEVNYASWADLIADADRIVSWR